VIENEVLYKSFESRQFHDLVLNENISLVPPRVWNAYVFWYGKAHAIKRTVIKYKNVTEFRAPNGYTGNNIIRLSPDETIVFELEIDLVTIHIGLITENGKRPKVGQIIEISLKMTLRQLKDRLCQIFNVEDADST
jgi:hypothetical protein